MDIEVLRRLVPCEVEEVVQTHISVVFVCEDVVYKVKKPVNFGFLDFSTLEKREFYCRREVELNRRLCPDAYLGVVPLEGEGVFEWAVKMKRLPMERSLKSLIIRGEVCEGDVRRVMDRIVEFHATSATTREISSYGRAEAFRRNTDENFEQTRDFVGKTIEEGDYLWMLEKTEEFYRRFGSIMDKRADEGFVKDCHGDLHCEHIVVADRICIFDCIEFNERFRYSDVACDVAFLLMDMDFLGESELSGFAESLYRKRFPQPELEVLLPFYKAYRAYVRGKVNSFMSVDPALGEAERGKKAELARRYFALARSYMEEVPW